MSTALSHRRGVCRLQLRGADGSPLANQQVRVEQVQHEFGFGCTSPSMAPDREQERELWLQLFDSATLPLFYWVMFGWYEPLLALGGCIGALSYPKEVRAQPRPTSDTGTCV